MNKRYMRIRKIVIPTITAMLIASQLMGCAAASEGELMDMINRSESIEIEVAVPAFAEQGEKKEVTWERLDQLTEYKDFRKSFEDELKIVSYGDGSKNGVIYIDLEGNQEGNNTLFNAFMNRKFISTFWENESALKSVNESVSNVYTDITKDSPSAPYAAINAYWNLLPDSTPGYFNGGTTLTRGEAMALIMRAENPVTESKKPEGDSAFTSAVGVNEYTDYASYLSADSYLDIESKSLNNQTFNGTITRGEYIYILMKHYLPEKLELTETEGKGLRDCKEGGLKEGENKEYWKSYELSYILENPEKGVPTEMYKGLILAKEIGIIEEETRWDEGLTKAEGIELLCRTYEAYTKQKGYKVDGVMGVGAGTAEAAKDMERPNYAEAQSDGIEQEDFKLIEMDKKMQATENADTYAMPDGDEVKSVVQQDEIVSIIGKVDGYNWYKIIQEGEIESYIDGVYLEEIKETPSQGQQVEVQQPQPEIQQPTQEQPAVQPSVEQPPQETSPQEQPAQPSNGRGINPATGEPYKDGDRNEAGIILSDDMTDFMSDPNNW